MYFIFPNLKAEEGTAGLQEELELPEAFGIFWCLSGLTVANPVVNFTLYMVAWGSYPDTPCMDDLPTFYSEKWPHSRGNGLVNIPYKEHLDEGLGKFPLQTTLFQEFEGGWWWNIIYNSPRSVFLVDSMNLCVKKRISIHGKLIIEKHYDCTDVSG